jgi:hypothetical protein
MVNKAKIVNIIVKIQNNIKYNIEIYNNIK